MVEVSMWFNPACSKCRTAEGLLAERGVATELVHYLDRTPGRGEVERVLRLLGTDDPRAITRTGEPLYGELGLADAGPDALVEALVAHPELIERPIVIVGERAVVARPPERLLALLDGSETADDG